MGKSLTSTEARELLESYHDMIEDYVVPYFRANNKAVYGTDVLLTSIRDNGMYVEADFDDEGDPGISLLVPWSLFDDFAGTLKRIRDEKTMKTKIEAQEAKSREYAAYLVLKEKYDGKN